MKVSILRALEERLAKENRRVVSDWRATLLLRKATTALPIQDRRWNRPPTNPDETRIILARLVKNGDLTTLSGLSHIYQVTSPYAQQECIEEEEILMELHPYAALSHFSALAFHQVTEELPKEIHVITSADRIRGAFPIGTTAEDWQDLVVVSGRRVKKVNERVIHWHEVIDQHFFGIGEYRPHGYSVQVTDLERTLLDGLRQPEWCGGFENVLRAWGRAKDILDLNKLVSYVDELDIGVLRQRTGFLLEQIRLWHPVLNVWPAKAQRGGSSKLLGSAPFAPTYSERWQISLNAPLEGLMDDAL